MADEHVPKTPTLAVHWVSLPVKDNKNNTRQGKAATPVPARKRTVSKVNPGAETPPHDQCLLLCRKALQPVTYRWKSSYRSVALVCAFHSSEQFVCWSPQPGQLCCLHGDGIELLDLPEPGTAGLENVDSMYRELHFSKDHSKLWLVIFTCKEVELGLEHTLSVVEYDVNLEGDKLQLIQASFSTLAYLTLGAVLPPGVLTAWTENTLFVTIPPLSSKPKVLRYSLMTSSKAFETLREPIFFPSTTAVRNPVISALPNGKEDVLILLLAAETPSREREVDEEGAAKPLPCSLRQTAVVQGPIHIAWKLREAEDWRDWDEQEDGTSDEYKRAASPLDTLRGSYIDRNKPFKVTVRSGLNWQRQAFLSCY